MHRSKMAFGLFLAALSGGAALAEIGVLAAVNRDMMGTRPAEQARPIFIKERLVANERIVSSNGGGGQVLFLDQTSLTIAPNSEIILDQYVYDPDSQTGELAVSVLSGAMRFVGGRISKENPAVIKTPTATIGIRGGMGSVSVQNGPKTLYMHVAGLSSTITSGDQELTITREGGLASIGADGGLEYLGVAEDDFIANAFRPGAAGQGGGGGDVATAAVNTATAVVSSDLSGDPGSVVQAAISTLGERQSVDFGELDVDFTVEPTTEFHDALVALRDELVESPSTGNGSFLAAGIYNTTAIIEGSPVNDANSFFQLVFSPTSNEGTAFVGIPETGDNLTFLEGDGTSGFGDQFLVQLDGENTFISAAGLATVLLGDPTGSQFTLTQGEGALLSGSVAIDYTNSGVVTFLESLSGDVNGVPVIFIDQVAGQDGVEIDTLQAELDFGIEEFKKLLQGLPR